MGKGRCPFTETDVKRAVRAARKMGIEPAVIRYCKNGTIEIVAKTDEPACGNGTDLELAEFEARRG